MITETKFTVPIYCFNIEIVVFDDADEARDKFPEWMTQSTSACVVGTPDENRIKIIVPSYNRAQVVHELEHAKNIIWRFIEYTPQADNDEVDAYLLEFLYDRVDKIIEKHLASKC